MRNFFKRYFLVIITISLLFTAISIKLPQATAATINLYPSEYAYVKPAPYWTCSPCDQFSTSQQVTILERDYDFFYVQYTRGGVTKRGYMAMSLFNESNYNGYHWCSHTTWTPAYNSSGASQTTYYSPTGSASTGSIDSDEGTNPNKPLFVLRYENNRAFVQYVTNPGTSGHVLYKRAWVASSAITLSPPSSTATLGEARYVILKNVGTGKYLNCQYNSSTNTYTPILTDSNGYDPQHWLFTRYGNATSGYCYKIESGEYNNMVLQVDPVTAIVGNRASIKLYSTTDKAQEYYIDGGSTSLYIKTRCSGGYMALQASADGTTITQERYDSTNDYQRWIHYRFSPPEYDEREFFPYATTSSGETIVNYYIETTDENKSVVNAYITVDQVNAAAAMWNTRVNQTKVRLVRTTNSADAEITIFREIGLGCYADTGETMTSDGNTVVYKHIRIDPLHMQSLTDLIKTRTIAHEFGHALGLDHTRTDPVIISYEPYEFGVKHLFYSLMHAGPGEETVVGTSKDTDAPSDYDFRMVACKWAGTPNYPN